MMIKTAIDCIVLTATPKRENQFTNVKQIPKVATCVSCSMMDDKAVIMFVMMCLTGHVIAAAEEC